jgi:NAD(P)H-hydrate epimerase
MNLQELIDMSYAQLVQHLLDKYGPAKYDYFNTPECKSKSTKLSRTKEGLFCHHIAENKEILKTKKCPLVFTPHPGEFARLTGLNIDEINSNRIFLASKYANELSSIILLKGAATVISSVEGEIRLNSSGNSGMATAGSGDVLSGIIAALLAQGMNLFDSASIGAYIHGLSGDIAKEKLTEFGMIASDIIDNIPYAFKKIV